MLACGGGAVGIASIPDPGSAVVTAEWQVMALILLLEVFFLWVSLCSGLELCLHLGLASDPVRSPQRSLVEAVSRLVADPSRFHISPRLGQ